MEQKHREIILNNIELLIESTQFEPVFNILVGNGMFSNHMVQKIREGRNDIEQKKTMYTMIPKRGPHAFDMLCQALRNLRYEKLADLLIKNVLVTSPSGRSRSPVWVTQVYQMTSNPRGYVLLININEYSNSCDKREGSKLDEEKLCKLWTNLGYEVDCHNKLDKEEFEEVIIKFRNFDGHKDSAVVFIMTHGNASDENETLIDLKCSDHRFVSSRWILNQFTVNKCPNLKGKPKLFFFAVCRGLLNFSATQKYNENERIEFDSSSHCKRDRSDMLIMYSTVPGHLCPRDQVKGKQFVQMLCDILSSQAKDNDLLSILKEVQRRLLPFLITPCLNNWGFDKKLYFNPLK